MRSSFSRQNNHPDFGVSFYQIFIGSYDKLELDLNLLTQNFGREPNFHPNGGVSDLRIIHKGQAYYASDLFTTERVTSMLNKKDCYWIAFYPKKYQDSPQALRERIRKNEAIIKDREFQSHFKKGKFDTDKKVRF